MAGSDKPPARPIVTPEQARANRLAYVNDLHNDALSESGYLGVPDAHQNYRWFQLGSRRVAVKADVPDDIPPNEVEPAEFFVYAMVSGEDCFLHSTGNWEKPTPFTPNISDVKLNFKCGRPIGFGPDIANAFDAVTRNIVSLQKKAEVSGGDDTCSVVTPSKLVAGTNLVKFRHALFTKKVAGAEDVPVKEEPILNGGNTEAARDAVGNQKALKTYTIENWPAPSPAVRDALDAIVDTHDISIPPFYDQHGYLICPNEGYRGRLEGSLAQVRFTLTHHVIGGGRSQSKELRNVFVADIAEIHVVYSAPPRVITPRKRRIFAVHPLSPSKKRKAT